MSNVIFGTFSHAACARFAMTASVIRRPRPTGCASNCIRAGPSSWVTLPPFPRHPHPRRCVLAVASPCAWFNSSLRPTASADLSPPARDLRSNSLRPFPRSSRVHECRFLKTVERCWRSPFVSPYSFTRRAALAPIPPSEYSPSVPTRTILDRSFRASRLVLLSRSRKTLGLDLFPPLSPLTPVPSALRIAVLTRACSTKGVFAGSASLRSNTPFAVRRRGCHTLNSQTVPFPWTRRMCLAKRLCNSVT